MVFIVSSIIIFFVYIYFVTICLFCFTIVIAASFYFRQIYVLFVVFPF